MKRLLALACTVGFAATPLCAQPERAPTIAESLTGGAQWSAIIPDNWNGVLLLHSRGYAAQAGNPEPAPAQYRDALLAQGFALAASNYGAGGWSVAEAVPAQEQVVAAFAERYGKPRRVIGYGFSMGGLVTTALAERSRPVLDGAISLCSSMGGSLGMMNMGLDGAFVFRTLVAPEAGIELVGVKDDRANAQRVAEAVRAARLSPAGRARMALAAVLAGIPDWVAERPDETEAQRFERQWTALAGAFPMGIFLPRSEQEQRAGGNFSWNTNVDYARQLALSGRADLVRHFYREAGLDLSADLSALAQAARIPAAPKAVDYMAANYIPDAAPRVPLLAIQALGDPITSPSLQLGYAEAAKPQMVQSLFLPAGGHCQFTAEQMSEAVTRLSARLDKGDWPQPAPIYTTERPAPMLRPCFRGGQCAGRPE